MAPDRLDESASGVYIISATPFQDDGSLDLGSADRLADFYIEQGVSGITVLGMMGEAQKMAPEESEQFLLRMLKRVNGKLPIVVGVSSAGMDNLVRLSRISMDNGAKEMADGLQLLRAGIRGAGRRHTGLLPGLSAGHTHRDFGIAIQSARCGLRSARHAEARGVSGAQQNFRRPQGI